MLVKVLEHKWVIRLFGILLILAPFFNVILTMSQVEGIQGNWNFITAKNVFFSTSSLYQILQVASIVLGSLMLNGSPRAWTYMLVLLAGHIIVQIPQLGHFKTNKIPWISLLVDIGLVFFIADQLVWKFEPKKRVVANPKPENPDVTAVQANVMAEAPASVPQAAQAEANAPVQTTKKKVMVHMEGFGPWAQLWDVSNQGICIRCLVSEPPKIKQGSVEFALDKDLKLNLRFSRKDHFDYYFDFVELSPNDVHSLNRWLQQLAI